MVTADSMKVLVTGGAGYIGSVLSSDLLGAGHRVRVLDALLYGGESLLGFLSNPNFEFIRGDIRSEETVRRALDGVEAVVHLAAIVGDPACARQPDLARAVNRDAAVRLYDLSREAGVRRFIFASTCSNYGRMADPSAYLTEESELRPVSLYAETKVAVEQHLLSAKAGAPPVTCVLRFATVFGISPRMRLDLTVNEFALELATKRSLTIYGEQFWRPYVHVRDVSRAVQSILDAPAAEIHSQAFNVGDTTQNFQKRQIVDIITAHLPHPVDVRTVQKDEDPRDYRVSFDKIKRRIGFRITRPLTAGVRELLDAIHVGVLSDVDHPRYRN